MGRRVVVMGLDAEAVARTVSTITDGDEVRAAGYVGNDEDAAREMAEEMLGGVDEVIRVPARDDWGTG